MISLVLPVMNQADHIVRVLENHTTGLEALATDFEIIPVVNGSTDESFAQCTRLAECNSAIRPFEETAGGFGLAIKRGLREARGEVLCFANSARTSTADLVYVLRFALRNPDFVVKANRSTYDSAGRRLGSIAFNLLCRSLFDLKCWDMNGTPKVFSRKFDRLLHLTQNDSMVDTEFNAVCRRYDYPMIELPLAATPRHGGRSSTNYRTAINLYAGAIQFAREFRRQHGSRSPEGSPISKPRSV